MAGRDGILSKWIGKTAKLMGSYVNEQLLDHKIDLTKTQLIVLKFLQYSDRISQNKLAFITERDKTSLTRLMNTMEKKELVNRKPSAGDKRIKLVGITDKGRKLLSEAEPVLSQLENQISDGISTQEMNITIKVLEQVQANVNQDSGV